MFSNKDYFENRELSWLKFEQRVLNEAKEEDLPILERLKFLAITSSNLDEFFMVRLAAIKDMVKAGYRKKDFSGRTPKMQLQEIHEASHALVNELYEIYEDMLCPILEKEGIKIYHKHEELSEKQLEYIDEYFMRHVFPVLTPIAIDASRPFPLVRNQSLNIAALLHPKKKFPWEVVFSTVQVPEVLPRLVPLSEEEHSFILLEQVIEHNMDKLFLNHDVVAAHPYRLIRNADLAIDEDEVADLLKAIQKQLIRRQWGEVICLEVEDSIDRRLLEYLVERLKVSKEEVYLASGPIDFSFLMPLYKLPDCDKLRINPYVPQPNARLSGDCDIFSEIKKQDIFLFHPYESFEPVVDFIRQAADDPKVLAIKQTLYRVSGNSPIVSALAKAAKNGKQVTVLVELKARFDEENNIGWAKKLEKAGCHVIYGLAGLKTHCKVALVVRQENDCMMRYIHLGTGNYNDSTAKLYTDCGLFTCKESFGEDATALFNMLSGYSKPVGWNKLLVAPLWLRDGFVHLIEREIGFAKEGKKAKIIAKMNSLCDGEIIQKLYEASAAGVEIQLIVRGICCLKTGIPGVSEHIEVRSIVGTYLEHSRIYYFYNGGEEEYYMGSADWMPRNMDRRVEVLFPVEDADIKERLQHILDILLQDTKKAYRMEKDGCYYRSFLDAGHELNAQEEFCKEAMKINE